MIYITLTDHEGKRVQLNIEAIGFFRVYDGAVDGANTDIFVTGGTGGNLYVQETPAAITERLKEAGCEFV